MYKYSFLFIIVFHFCNISLAQNNQKMNLWQDSLLSLATNMYQSEAEPERIERNYTFVKTLVSSLKEPNSFYFKFDKLNMISIVSPPDQTFRIFTWNIPLQDGSYLYYGAIQQKSGQLQLTPLLDKTFEIKNPHNEVLPSTAWYGAQYYDIVPLEKGNYVLLGWKGHHRDFTQKVIEILKIGDHKNIQFGSAVFSDDAHITRKIFSYTREASMYLAHNAALSRIEFDHLVPAADHLSGDFKYYGPDLTYDTYYLKNGKLLLEQEIELKNPVRGDEFRFIDPKKLNPKLKSGLNM